MKNLIIIILIILSINLHGQDGERRDVKIENISLIGINEYMTDSVIKLRYNRYSPDLTIDAYQDRSKNNYIDTTFPWTGTEYETIKQLNNLLIIKKYDIWDKEATIEDLKDTINDLRSYIKIYNEDQSFYYFQQANKKILNFARAIYIILSDKQADAIFKKYKELNQAIGIKD